MKFTKVIILASALAVSAVPQIAHSQDAATPATSKDSRVAEWSKDVGKDCTIFVSNRKGAYQGNLESVTNSWIEISNDVRNKIDGKMVSLTFITRIPMKDVTRVSFEVEKLTEAIIANHTYTATHVRNIPAEEMIGETF